VAKGYEFVGGDKPFKCLKCGKQFSSEGGYNLHGPCGPGYRKGRGQDKTKGGGCKCGGNFRLLNESVPIEDRAIKAGHVSVCNKCGELR
jgi:uncharacterized C2H2 Zn-finger protein